MAEQTSPSTAVHPTLAEAAELPLLCRADASTLTLSERPRTSYNTSEPLPTASLQTTVPPPAATPLVPTATNVVSPLALRRPSSARASLGSLDAIPRQTIIKALASVARGHKPEALSLESVLAEPAQPQDTPTTDPTGVHAATITAASATTAASTAAASASTTTTATTTTTTTTTTTDQSAMADEASSPGLTPQVSRQPLVPPPPPQPSTTAASSAASHPPSSSQLCDALNDLALRHGSIGLGSPLTPAAAALSLSALQSPCYYHQRFDDAVDIDKVLEEIKNDDYMSHSRLVQTATGVREVSKQLQRRPIRRAVRNVMIVTKARDNDLVVLTRELAQWLMATPRYGSDMGVNVYVDAKLRNAKRFDAVGLLASDPRGRFAAMLRYWTPDLCWSQPEKFDLVITLGGDGTVLFTSWLFQRVVPPVLSFSLGSLGFLTTFEFQRFRDHLDHVMGSDGMRVNLRMRFTCTVYREGKTSLSGSGLGSADDQQLEEGEQFEVLNELVIDRGPSPYVSNLELYGDNELLTVVQADGCIFSTPTGSTAYSLSAGGSLVHPDIPAILLTPICPHTLSFRPMVLSDTMLLRVSIPRHSRATAYCAFDGKGRVELRQGDCVTITASQYPFPTVTRTDTEWFDSVSRTLRWNTRAATQKGFDPASGSSATALKAVAEKDDADWDIDTDSAYYASEEGSAAASPLRRQMSLLGL